MARKDQIISIYPKLEQKFGLSYAVKADQPTVHLSGILSADEDFNLVGEGDPVAQLSRIYERLEFVLAQFGATLEHVVSEINFTTDMAALSKAGWVRDEFYNKAGAAPPAATAVQVSGLYLPGALFELHPVAQLPA